MPSVMLKTSTPGVFKRGSRYVVTYRDQHGRQRKESARTVVEARALKARRDSEVADGTFEEPSRITFKEYALAWVDRYEGPKKIRESTREEYRRAIMNSAIPFLGEKQMRAIAPGDVQRYVDQLTGAYGTRSNQLKPVRVLFRSAVTEGIIKINPAREIVVPQPQRIEEDDEENTRAFSREELTLVLALVPVRHRLLFNLLAATGLRISEALGLRWRDLVLEGERPVVRVRRAWVRGRWHAPKSRHGRREVALPQDLVFRLREARVADPEALVFPSERGTPLHVRNLRARALDPVCEEAGVPWAGFHTFRHTYASLQIAHGVQLVPLSRALGHHSAAFTLSVYTHLLDGDEAPALELPVGTEVATEYAEPHLNGGAPLLADLAA